MRALSFGVVLVTQAAVVLGHWNYNTLIVNGQTVGQPYQYIRRTNNSNSPIQMINSTDMRCNSGGDSGAQTQTYAVTAGDEVGFGIGAHFGHPGPQQVYLSRAPGAAADYDGSGDWVKIYAATTLANTTMGDQGLVWATHNIQNFRFKLSEEIPAGEYLLRAEGIALHAAHKLDCAQFYIGCAQLKVIGNGKGTLGPAVKFPGAYTDTTPGVLIPAFWTKITNYTVPGPALWPSGTQEQHVVLQL